MKISQMIRQGGLSDFTKVATVGPTSYGKQSREAKILLQMICGQHRPSQSLADLQQVANTMLSDGRKIASAFSGKLSGDVKVHGVPRGEKGSFAMYLWVYAGHPKGARTTKLDAALAEQAKKLGYTIKD